MKGDGVCVPRSIRDKVEREQQISWHNCSCDSPLEIRLLYIKLPILILSMIKSLLKRQMKVLLLLYSV